MPLSNVNIRQRRSLLVAMAGIGIVLVAILCVDLAGSRRQAFEKARSSADNASLLLSERLHGSLHEVDYVLDDIAESAAPRLSADPATASRDFHKLLLLKLEALPQACGISLLAPNGAILASSDPIAPMEGSPVAEAQQRCIRALRADAARQVAAADAFNGEAPSTNIALIYARAVRDAEGRLLAAACARVDATVIDRALAETETSGRWTVFVTDPERRVFASKPALLGAIGKEVSDPDLRALLLEQTSLENKGVSSSYAAKGPYCYYSRSGAYPLYVSIREARDGILMEWRKRLAAYVIAALAIGAFIVVLMRLLSKNFARSAELSARLVAMQSASDMIAIADRDGRVEYVNPSFERLTGIPRDKAIGSREAIFGSDEADAAAALAAVARGESWRGEIAAEGASGERLVEEVTVSPVPGPDGESVGIVAILRDVTERRRLQERLERLAHYDSLTTLPNRALFFDRLEGAVARSKREDRRFALLFIDLDGFKSVNDRFGHDAGDYLLFELAQRLKSAIRDSDTAGRMGGDEFTILLDTIAKSEDAAIVAEKLRAELARPALLPIGAEVRVGASIGIAVFPEDGTSAEAILKAADSDMYDKKLGSGDKR